MTTDDTSNGKLSRRLLMGGGLAAAASLPLVAQAQPMQRHPVLPQGMSPQPPRTMQGGTGKTKVLFISKYHAFDRENLFAAFDHPVGEVFARRSNHGERGSQFVRNACHEFHLLMRQSLGTPR